MLQELAAETGLGIWSIVSTALFFLAWLGVAAWVYRTRAEEFDSRARLPLEGEAETLQTVPSAMPTEH